MGTTHSFKLILIAAMLMLASRSHAVFTPYLETVSNTLAAAHASLTNDTAQERRDRAIIARALKTLAKPSTSVATDYSLFVTAATQLGPIAATPEFLELGTNVFTAFTNDAQAQIVATGDRIAALSEFVRSRKAASNNLNQAQAALDRIPTLTDIRLAFLVGRQVFTKINNANRITTKAEAKPGLAANSLAGLSLTHNDRDGDTGVVSFTDGSNYTETDDSDPPQTSNGTYEYRRTGLNTGELVLTQGDEDTTTVKLTFTSTSAGRFTFRNVSPDGSESGSGTFTLN